MSARAKSDSEIPGLDERHREVLKAVIRAHVRTGEPVGSQTVSRAGKLRLSPASIRNIMAELAERGLLTQPHTSAGRLPTDLGYRLYVDHLVGRPQVGRAAAQAIDDALARSRGEVDDLLESASRQLSQFSNQVGLVLAPEIGRINVERLEFVRLEDGRVVAILVGRSGVLHSRILKPGRVPEQDELDRIGRYLSDEFGGMTLPEMRDALRRRWTEERAAYDRLVSTSLALGAEAVAVDDATADLFVDGTSNLLLVPEFADLDIARSLLRALEDKKILIDLLGRVLAGEGVKVVIGEENPLSDLARCSLVASTYGSGERVFGSVGIVGPTRMEYARAIALVEYLAGVLSRLLSSD